MGKKPVPIHIYTKKRDIENILSFCAEHTDDSQWKNAAQTYSFPYDNSFKKNISSLRPQQPRKENSAV